MSFMPDEGPGVDFDDLYEAWKEVGRAESQYNSIKDEIDRSTALFKRQCLLDKDYWPRGKPPSMEYLKQVVHYLGNTKDDEQYLRNMTDAMIESSRRVTEAKGRLDKLHEQIRVWQTQSANKRKTLVIE